MRFIDPDRAVASGTLVLANDIDVLAHAAAVQAAPAVALEFPKWTDGRAYSQAVLLRTRLGFAGELRATGEVLVDMLPLLARCGFDAVALCAGQDEAAARRALEVCAAGAHSLLMSGPPGAGKSMLAQRLPGLLPALGPMQALEVAALSGLAAGAGRLPVIPVQPLLRAPHHTVSAIGLVGGASRPGEISLAHHGVLFLDELPEFRRDALEALREPLETGRVAIARATRRVEYPANFQLVAAMNPCPCGWRGHPTRSCRCTPDQVARYASKLSGPLLDRIDLHVTVPPADPSMLDGPPGESSAAVRERVMRCRARQEARQGCANAYLQGADMERHCEMSDDARELLRQAVRRLDVSGRALHRATRVARTVAVLDASDRIESRHVAEAIQYRRR
jgi:magnesium chelatase family protein